MGKQERGLGIRGVVAGWLGHRPEAPTQPAGLFTPPDGVIGNAWREISPLAPGDVLPDGSFFPQRIADKVLSEERTRAGAANLNMEHMSHCGGPIRLAYSRGTVVPHDHVSAMHLLAETVRQTGSEEKAVKILEIADGLAKSLANGSG